MIGFAQRSPRKKYAEAQKSDFCGEVALITRRVTRDLETAGGFAANGTLSAAPAYSAISARTPFEAAA